MNHENLAHEHCVPQQGQAPLAATQIGKLLEQVAGWHFDATAHTLSKDFRFQDFHHTLGFINAVAFIANQQDHHPDLEAGYGHCTLHWSTHDVGGLSRNDFICAARVDALLATA